MHYDVTTNSVVNGVWPDILSVTQYTGPELILACTIHAIHALCNCTDNVHTGVWSDSLVHWYSVHHNQTINILHRLVSRIVCQLLMYIWNGTNSVEDGR